jgi:hypothetical protein
MNEYKDRTYEELSQEFRKIYPTLTRAYELVALMYNLLTSNGLPHKVAITKIRDDHKDLLGFSTRNIYRCLPRDNPYVPRRVVPPRHKNSVTETSGELDFSNTKGEQDNKIEPSGEGQNVSAYVSEQIYHGKKSQIQKDDTSLPSDNQNQLQNDENVLRFECLVPLKDIWEDILIYIAIEDNKEDQIWFNGKINKITGQVIAVYPGRLSEQNKTD